LNRHGQPFFPGLLEEHRDRSDTQIDLAALNATERIIRLGSCKRSAAELVRDLPVFCGHVERFLHQFPEYAGWRVERVSLAPHVPRDVRREIEREGFARARARTTVYCPTASTPCRMQAIKAENVNAKRLAQR